MFIMPSVVAKQGFVDVAHYQGPGASRRGIENVYAALVQEYKGKPNIRVTNLTNTTLVDLLSIETRDVIFFPGGSGSTMVNSLGAAGLQAVRDFVFEGGGFVGVCAGAYFAIGNSGTKELRPLAKISPFSNLPKPKPNPPGRGDGNVTLRAVETDTTTLSQLRRLGVLNEELDPPGASHDLEQTDGLLFYAGAPVMYLKDSLVGNLPANMSDPRLLVEYTSTVPIE